MRLVPHGQTDRSARLRRASGITPNRASVTRDCADAQDSGLSAAAPTCVAWQAARAARARAIAAWASDVLTLRKCGIASDHVQFAGFSADAAVDLIGDVD